MMRIGKHFVAVAITLAAIFGIVPNTALANEPTTLPLVMIVVGFDGGDDPEAAVPYSDEYDWSAALFDANESPAAYFLNMSEGTLAFTPARETSAMGVDDNSNEADQIDDGVIHVTLPRSHGAWGAVNVDPNVTRDFARLVTQALEAAVPYIDYTAYDTDGDGALSQQELAICICVAGYEASPISDYDRTDIPLMWAHSGILSATSENDRRIDGLDFDPYIAISEQYWEEYNPIETAEQEPLGVVYHELGHALGLPDLYAVKYTEGPWEGYEVGALSLMDQGGWQYADDGKGWHNIPTALDAWSRYVLGWIEPTIVTKSGDYLVSSQLSDAGYSQLIIPTDDPNEYYLIENRPIEGQDIGLTDDYDGPVGIIAWHIDNGILERYYGANQVNDANHHPAVMPENLGDETTLNLLLYNDGNDDPEACIESGVSISFSADAGQDATVHIELDETTTPTNAIHLIEDAARNSLGPKRALVPTIVWMLRGCV